MLQQQSLVVVTETLWPTKLKILFLEILFTEGVCSPCCIPEFLKLCSVKSHDQLSARNARLDKLNGLHCRTYQSLYFADVHCESPDRVYSIEEFQTYLATESFNSCLSLKAPVEHSGDEAQMRLRET